MDRVVVYGGVAVHHHLKELRNGVHVLVATPGTLFHQGDQVLQFGSFQEIWQTILVT